MSQVLCIAALFLSLPVVSVQASSVILTSNVEREGQHIACTNTTVIFECTANKASRIAWVLPSNDAIVFPSDSPVGDSRTRPGNITAILTENIGVGTFRNFTSTLTYPFISNGTQISCQGTGEAKAIVIADNPGTLPDPPQNIDCTLSSLDCSSNLTTLSCTITPPAGNQPIVEYVVDVDGQQVTTVGANSLTNVLIGVVCGDGGVTVTVRSNDLCGQLSNATVVTIGSSVCISPTEPPPPPNNLTCSLASSSSGCNDDEVLADCEWEPPTGTVPVSFYTLTATRQQPVTGISQGTTSFSLCVEHGATITVASISECGRMSAMTSTTLDRAGGLSTGAAAGITIAIVLAVVVCTVLIIVFVYLISRRRRNKFSPTPAHTVAMSKLPQATPPVIKMLEVCDITETSAQVKWKIKKVKSDSDCDITLTVEYMDGNIALVRCPSWKENGYKIEDLIPGVQYQVYLTASNENGESVTKRPEELITKCGDISVFTTPYLAIWKSLHQYREPPDEITYTVKCDESMHKEDKMSNTETVKTVKVDPGTTYSVFFTVRHRKGTVTSDICAFTTPKLLPKCAKKFITLTKAMPYYVWQEQGVTVKLRKHSLPDGSDACPVKIEVSLPNCPEMFPDNNDPVSPVVHVSTPVQLKKPLKVTVVQCGGTKATVAVVAVISPGKKFTVNESMMVKKPSKSTTAVSGVIPECCFVVVSESSTAFCAHVYYDDQKGDLYMTLAKNIPVYSKVLNDYAKKKGFRKVQEISGLSFRDGQDVMTAYDTNMLPLAEFDRYMCSYFTYPEDAPTGVVHLDQDQPFVYFKVNFSETKDCWIHFSTRQEKRKQELDVKNIVSLRAVTESNLLLGKLHMWQEIAFALGVGDRITSISHTYQEDGHDQLCALEVIAQWIKHNPHPTSEALVAALCHHFTDWTDLQTLKVCVKEDAEDVQNSQTEVKMDDIDEVMKRQHLSTNWELLAVAFGLGAYISFISKKEKSARARALIQLWITLEERSSTWSELSEGLAIAGI